MRLKAQLEQARLDVRDESGRAGVERALAEADQLIATFNSLLRLARLEGGEGAEVADLDLADVAGDALELWQPLAEAGGRRIDARIESAPMRGDRDLLFQLISNLLDNAIKFTVPGGRLEIEVRPVPGGGARLVVGDDGPGIPPEDRDRVLDRFVRLERHRGSPGSGLGLSVVRAIAVRHGAGLYLESNSPGLRVELRFPPMGP
jgi:signal transduction histidine kinase